MPGCLFQIIDKLDLYSDNFKFNIEKGRDSLKTLLGAVLSLVSLCWVLMFAYLKYKIMIEYDDTNIKFSTINHYYDDNITYAEKMNFTIAFSLVAYDGIGLSQEDPDIATLEVFTRHWGHDDHEKVHEVPLGKHKCTKEELGIDYYNTTGEE